MWVNMVPRESIVILKVMNLETMQRGTQGDSSRALRKLQNNIDAADVHKQTTIFNMNDYKTSVENNDGVISTGTGSINFQQVINSSKTIDDIKWDALISEMNTLKTSTDLSIKKFTDEASEAVNNKDKKKVLNILSKWLPCIGTLIESSYYIIELAKNFNIRIG